MNAQVRPTLRRFAIVAFAILLPAALHSLWDYVEIQRLVREIERIRDKGEPVTEEEADGRGRPQTEEGGAGLYYSAAGMLALGADPYRANSAFGEWLARSPHAQPIPQQLVTPLQALAQQSPDALALADKAAALPFTGFPGGTDFSYRTAGIGSLSQLIAARSVSLSIAGDGDRAVDSEITGLQVRRATRQTRFGFAGNSEIGSVLSLARPSPEALRRIQTALEAQDLPEQPFANFLRERAAFVERIWRRSYGSLPNAPRRYTLPMRSVTERIQRPWLTHQTVEVLRLWAELMEVARTPWPDKAKAGAQRLKGFQSASSRSGHSANLDIGRDLAIGSFAQAVDATSLIIDRCSIVIVAVERFRRDRGSMPATLSDVVPGYLAAVPIDPLSGNPLLFRSSADAFTVYSVGPNGLDDGGDLTSQLDGPAARPWNRRGKGMGADVGIRVLTSH